MPSQEDPDEATKTTDAPEANTTWGKWLDGEGKDMHFLHRCRRCRAVLAQCRCPSQDKAVTFLDPPPGHVCDSEAVAYEEPAAKVEEALRSRVADLENEISLAMAALGDCTDGEDGRTLNQRLADTTFEYEGTVRRLLRRIADLEHENSWLRRGRAAQRFSIGERVRSLNNSLGVITGINLGGEMAGRRPGGELRREVSDEGDRVVLHRSRRKVEDHPRTSRRGRKLA